MVREHSLKRMNERLFQVLHRIHTPGDCIAKFRVPHCSGQMRKTTVVWMVLAKSNSSSFEEGWFNRAKGPCQSPRSLHCQASIIPSDSLMAIYICWGCSRDASLMKDKAIRVVRRFPRLNPESRRLVEVTLGNNVEVGRHIFIGSFHKLISSIEQTVVATFSYPCLWWKLHEFQSKSLHLQIDRLTCRRGLYQKNSENNTKQV